MATDQAEIIRAWLRKVMDARYGGKLAPWARAACVPESAPRNFLAGRSRTLTGLTLQRLADAAGEAAPVLGGREAAPGGIVGADDVKELHQSVNELKDALREITRAIRARRRK